MKTLNKYSPIEAIMQGICSPMKGAIVAGAALLVGFTFGVFFALLPKIELKESLNILMNCFGHLHISFPASLLAVIAIPWSFLLKAGYTVSAIIFLTSETPKTKIVILPIIFMFGLGDGLLFTRFLQQ